MRNLCVTLLFIALHQEVSFTKECTSPGKFPNDQNGICENFALCLMAGGNNFVQHNLTCPEGSIFNHFTAACTKDSGYQCAPDYACSEVGSFANLQDHNCTSYIVCVPGMTGVMTARSVNCPLNTVFDPTGGFCVPNNTTFKCHEEQNRTEHSSVGDVLVNLLETRASSSFNYRGVPGQVILLLMVTFLYN